MKRKTIYIDVIDGDTIVSLRESNIRVIVRNYDIVKTKPIHADFLRTDEDGQEYLQKTYLPGQEVSPQIG